MLSTLARHKRIVAYLGASYRPHPIVKEDHLFVITEYMEGVSNTYPEVLASSPGPLSFTTLKAGRACGKHGY